MDNRRWSRSDWIAVGVVGFLAGASLVPLIAAEDGARELANRSYCAANLRGIAQSMVVYAAENNDVFPFLPGTSNTKYDPAVKGQETTGKTADDALAEMYQGNTFANNPCATFWILVLKGQVSPKGFICRSDPFAGPPSEQVGKSLRMNFDSPKSLSYSLSYMWGPKDAKGAVGPAAWWLNTSDSSVPILSDIAPYLGADAKPGEAATRPAGHPVATTSPTDPMVLGGGDDLQSDAFHNSPNHLFAGQNVAFADCHVEFARRADIGQNNDNIWTQTVNVNGKPEDKNPDAGKLPGGVLGNKQPYDIVMVPTRAATGDFK